MTPLPAEPNPLVGTSETRFISSFRSSKPKLGRSIVGVYLPHLQGTASCPRREIHSYFFLRQAGRTDPRARRGSQQAKPTRTDSPGD